MPDFRPKIIQPNEIYNQAEEIDNNDMNISTADVLTGSMDDFKLANFFDVKYDDSHNMDRIASIKKAFIENGIMTISDMLLLAGDIERRIKPAQETDRLSHFIIYFKLYMQSMNINKELRAYER